MKLLITLSLLLVAVCAAPKDERDDYPPSAGRFSVNRAADKDTDVRNGNGGADLSLPVTTGMKPKGDLTRTERFKDLLKEYIEFLRQQVNLPKKKKKEIGLLALSILTGDDDWEDEVKEIFKGDAKRLVQAFIQAVQHNENRVQAVVQFFKEEYGKIFVQMLHFLGADGEDLPSVAAHIIKGTIRGFLKVFAMNLQGSESDAIAGAISGFGKTIATIFTDRERLIKSLLNYFRDEVADLVKVILERFLGDDHTAYKYFVKVVKAIRSEEEEDNLKPPSGTRVAV